MAKARLSGPPAIEPVAIPVDEYQHDTTATRGDAQNAGHEPVSPLSPRSEAIIARRQNTVRRVSPVNTPTRSRSMARGRQPGSQRSRPPQRTARSAPRESYPPASIRICPPRKPVVDSRPSRQGTVNAQNPVMVSQERHYSIRPEHAHASRPRSQSVQPIPDTFLQDFADHSAPAPQPSRSQSVPPVASRQAQHQRPTEHSSCAHCGKLQKNQRGEFICCPTCRGVFYCSTSCWDRRVCHRSVKCHICDCTQASSSMMDFKRCRKCLAKNREFWYCSEDCWGSRNCHVRKDQLPPPPRVPSKPQEDAFWDARAGRRPAQLPVKEGRVRRHGDLEAQRAKGARTPWSQRTGVSGTVWAAAITFLLLCIFVPIIIVFAKKNNSG